MYHVLGLQNRIIILFSAVLMTSFLIEFFIPSSQSSIIPLLFYSPYQQIRTQITTITTTIAPSQANSTTASSFTYENPIYGIRIQYPSDWEKLEFIQGRSGFNIIVIFRSPPENTSDAKLENLVIQVGNLPSENVSLAEVVSANINSLKQSLIDFELNESTTITIAGGGNPAHKIVYTEREENNELSKVMQVLMIKSDKIYLITYIAEQRKYDNYLPTIQNMIDSFEFITPQIIGKTT
jgi:hypothetical protein